MRAGFGISEEATVYLFAAQNPRLKGFEPLLAATRRLVDQGLDPVVLLAGNIQYAHQRAVAAARLTEHVRFVGPTQQMHALYAAADVTVLPTFYDPASKVVIESLMMGTPAISTAYNGASDLLRPTEASDGEWTGRVIDDPADDEALAAAMVELADPDTRRRCQAAMAGLARPIDDGPACGSTGGAAD